MKCGDCKWWGFNVQVSPSSDERVNQTGEYRQCGRLAHDERGVTNYDDGEIDSCFCEEIAAKVRSSPLRKELAVLKDGSGYYAALKCRSDFGCVLFEKKE